jgi:hypothetical protein
MFTIKRRIGYAILSSHTVFNFYKDFQSFSAIDLLHLCFHYIQIIGLSKVEKIANVSLFQHTAEFYIFEVNKHLSDKNQLVQNISIRSRYILVNGKFIWKV